MRLLVLAFTIGFCSALAAAAEEMPHEMHDHGGHAQSPAACGHMEAWDFMEGMCAPRAMAGMPLSRVMLHGNGFLTQIFEEGPRGQPALASPNMVMIEAGTSIGERQFFNASLMATFERWTFPKAGYPELLQIGEQNEDNQPYIDRQHPHSSPVMGLTFSDTISIGDAKDCVKIWFAPRGSSTDGPIAFMHRPTGQVNPDAPLGHHLGQDVGHITSTVLGASFRLGASTFEISTFNGTEPEPTKVDLPIASPNSYAARLTEEFSAHVYGMMSAAFVKNPEPNEPELDHVWRYSASLYGDHSFGEGWQAQAASIWGLINFYDRASALNSFTEELSLKKNSDNLWSRFEVLQRTPAELAINGLNDPDRGRWVTAVTLGYTRELPAWRKVDSGVGASVTKDFLPAEFNPAYGGDPLTAKIFLQVGGMNHRML